MMLSYLARLLTIPGGGGRVRRSITGALVTAALFIALPFVVQAAGLGKLTVTSPLGQPLNAEIEVVAVQPGEEDSLSAKLASPEAFAQAGMEMSPVLSSVRFAVEKRGGRTVLRITSTQPVNEPFLELRSEERRVGKES